MSLLTPNVYVAQKRLKLQVIIVKDGNLFGHALSPYNHWRETMYYKSSCLKV